jgi:CDP-glucose 4,6-dehydratase
MINDKFWAQQRVLLTGHTGFKGSWLGLWLEKLGSQCVGVSLPPQTDPNLYDGIAPLRAHVSRIADIRDRAALGAAMGDFQPTIAIHMAAQPLVRRSYRDPIETFEANVMGTANVLEALRGRNQLKAVLVITTDKVYENPERGHPFAEDDPLGGDDPYSASKAACEIAVQSWRKSFFAAEGIPVATARAGNVIGGGDWSEDRLIPDLWRAMRAGEVVTLRYPNATRPWQHVLEPLSGYLRYAERLAVGDTTLPHALNFGPDAADEMTVSAVAQIFQDGMGTRGSWAQDQRANPHEMRALSLDSTRAAQTLGWRPRLSVRDAVLWTADWYKSFDNGGDSRAIALAQISRYEALGLGITA